MASAEPAPSGAEQPQVLNCLGHDGTRLQRRIPTYAARTPPPLILINSAENDRSWSRIPVRAPNYVSWNWNLPAASLRNSIVSTTSSFAPGEDRRRYWTRITTTLLNAGLSAIA